MLQERLPTKRDAIYAIASLYPDASHYKLARVLGVSDAYISKTLKEAKKTKIERVMENKKQEWGGVTASVETITPEIADEFLSINTNNRKVNKETVDDYVAQMKKGLWRLNGEPIIISSANVILDGQHRLLAVKKSGVTIQSLVVWGVDGGESFATIDTGRTRTASDILSICKIPNANRLAAGITRYFTFNTGREAVVFSAGGKALRNNKKSKAEVLSFYEQHEDLCKNVNAATARCYDKYALLPYPTVFAIQMYLIINKGYDEDRVFGFFYQLFLSENVENNTINILREKLLQHAMKMYVLTSQQRLTYVVKTWNAYVMGKELTKLQYKPDREGVPDFLDAPGLK